LLYEEEECRLFGKVKENLAAFWAAERGDVSAMVWVVGAAVVVVLVVIAAMSFMPDTASTIWQQLVAYITSSFKF